MIHLSLKELIKLSEDLVKAAREDRDAGVKKGEYIITFHPKDKKLEADPEVKKYIEAMNKKMNTPEVLDALSNLTSQCMAYGSITDKEIEGELKKVL